jgi:RNA polymerase sigma-70 factor, ECF subfamily
MAAPNPIFESLTLEMSLVKSTGARILFARAGNSQPGMTDETLLAQARRGGEEAFRVLYERYRDPLFRFAYRLTASAPLAEDLVHDCFLGLLRSSFDAGRGALRPYLYGAVRNLVYKHFRDHQREEPTADFDSNIDRHPGPLVELIARETADEVRDAVSALPLLQREVLVMFEYEQMPLAAIATIVDADLAAVKSRLHRARERLRRRLRPTHCVPGGNSNE